MIYYFLFLRVDASLLTHVRE